LKGINTVELWFKTKRNRMLVVLIVLQVFKTRQLPVN